MKKLVVIFAVFLIACSAAFAQTISTDKVPAVVKQAFTKKYPKATDAKWEMEDKDYEVNFKLNGVESSANFDATGKCLESETEITFDALPQAVKDAIAKSFAGYKTGDVSKVVSKKKVLYEVDLTKGKEKLELQFNNDGKVEKRKIEIETEID
jgi:hypothetical protein